MGDGYSLTVHNQSVQPGLVFAVYAIVPMKSSQKYGLLRRLLRRAAFSDANARDVKVTGEGSSDIYPLTWLVKPIGHGSKFKFTWTLEFFLVYSMRGCREGVSWPKSKAVAVRPDDTAQNSALLDYPNDAYTFELHANARPVKGRNVYIDTTGSVPSWTQEAGPSVGLAIAAGEDGSPTPAIVTDSGPNLTHVLDLQPSFYLRAGQTKEGEMLELETVEKCQPVTFAPGTRAAEWTFDEANLWVKGAPPQK